MKIIPGKTLKFPMVECKKTCSILALPIVHKLSGKSLEELYSLSLIGLVIRDFSNESFLIFVLKLGWEFSQAYNEIMRKYSAVKYVEKLF